MANAAKFNKAACGHMFAHYERATDENGEYVKFKNESIDTKLSVQNYNLAVHQQERQGNFVKKRCGEVHCLNRKDINVLCSWIVTQPQSFPTEKSREFFEQTYKFLENRYGKENVVSAYVHMDETTPHIHFAFVPVVWDKKKERHTVSAKECISQKELKVFHKDMSSALNKHFRHDIGLHTDITAEQGGHKTISELKKETALCQQDLGKLILLNTEMEKRYLETITANNALESNVQALQSTLEVTIEKLHTEEESLKNAVLERNTAQSEIEDLKQKQKSIESELESLQGRILNQVEVNGLNGKKTLTGGLKGVSYEEYVSLKKTAEYVEEIGEKEIIIKAKEKEIEKVMKNLSEKERRVKQLIEIEEEKEISIGLKEIQDESLLIAIEEKGNKLTEIEKQIEKRNYELTTEMNSFIYMDYPVEEAKEFRQLLRKFKVAFSDVIRTEKGIGFKIPIQEEEKVEPIIKYLEEKYEKEEQQMRL